MIIQSIKEYTQDALLYFAEQVLRPIEMKKPDGEPDAEPVPVPVEMSPGQAQEAVNRVAAWIAKMPGDIIKAHYVDMIYKEYRTVVMKKTNLTAAITSQQAEIQTKDGKIDSESARGLARRLPKGIDIEHVMKNGGWYQVVDGDGTGIYFLRGADQEPDRVAEFTIDPVFHKVDRDDNCRVIKINNGYTGDQIIEMPSASLISADAFRKQLFDRGSYFFEGSQNHLNRIIKTIKDKFPKAWELKVLGWQEEGFYAYYNAVYNGELKMYDDAGLVEHDGRHYYSAAISQAFSDERQGDDLYENDRYLSYAVPPIDFKQWASLVKRAYPDHYTSMIMGCIYALFRDVHFKIDNNAPHIYFYGERGSGKSKAAETMSNFFFNQMPAFALSSGTDHAFSQRMRRFRNVISWMNEFDGDSIKPERRDAIKTAYDGEGRERGVGTSRHKTETQKVNSVLGLIGQFLYSGDDGSIPDRSIIEKFTRTIKRPKDQDEAYELLKQYEKQGLGGLLTEVLPYRPIIVQEYYKTFHSVMHGYTARLRKEKKLYQERIVRNYSALPAFAKILEKYLGLPFTYDEITEWGYERIQQISQLVSQTDVLLKFWTVMETLVSEGILRYGRYYKVETLKSARVSDATGDRVIVFSEPKEIMYIRLSACHQLYMKAVRSTGDKGIDSSSLENYMKDRDYFIGRVNSERFVESVTDIEIPGETHKKTKSKTYSAWLIDMSAAKLLNKGFKQDESWEVEKTPTQPETTDADLKASLRADDDKQEELAF